MVTLTPKSIKIFKTCNLYLCFIVLGLCISLPGPTLLDLQTIVNTDTKNIAFIYTARSVGYLIGSMAGGIVFDLLPRKQQMLMTFFILVVSLTMLAIPWSRSIGMLTSFMIVNGCSLGVVDTGGNVCCLNLWGKDSGPFFQALHFSFGLGGLIAPLVAAPFLRMIDPAEHNSYNDSIIFLNSTHQYNFENSFLNSSSITSPTIPTVTYAYSIIGCFGLLVTVIFLVTCIISPTDVTCQKSEDDKVKKNSRVFTLTIIFLNIILMFMETGTEIGYSQMLTTYAVKGPLKLPKTVGSFMTSAFWASFTISRLASVFLAIKLSSFTLIVFDLIVTSIGAVILLFLGGTQEWALWLATVILGIGIASFFPAAIGWLENYMTVTNKMAASFTVGAAMGEMVVPYAISHYIDEVPEVLLYVVPTSCALSGVVGFLMYLMLRKKDTKYVTEEGRQNAAFESNENA